MSEPDDLLEVSARDRIARLERLAESYYGMADVQQAARHYGEAYRIAAAMSDEHYEVKLGRWWGACLFECGRLREALSALAPVVRREPSAYESEFYVAVIKYIEAAQMIPVSLSSLRSAHDRLARYVSDGRLEAWEHMAIRLRADLACLRGDYRDAIALAQLGWHMARTPLGLAGPRFLSDEYLSTLVRSQLLSGDVQAAHTTLMGWQGEKDEIESYRTAVYNTRRSEVTRRAGLLWSAVDSGRAAVSAAEMSGHYLATCASLNALARAFLCSGALDLADETTSRLTGILREESLIESFRCSILHGDVVLGHLRVMAGLPITDEESLRLPPVGGQAVKGSGPVEAETVRKCRECYVSALEAGQKIDELLECEVWASAAQHRISRLRAVASIAEGGDV